VSIEATLWGLINSAQVFAPDLVERDGGHIVNIATAEVFGIRGAAPDVAITQAIVGLSAALYRELDSMGSRVGVTLVCPELGKTNIVGADEHRNSVAPSMRPVRLSRLPPEELADQIFAAVDARSFWFRPQMSSRMKCAGPAGPRGPGPHSAARSQLQRPPVQSGAYGAEENCPFDVAKHVTHLWKSY
jgi:short-subunit dehydrogenase